MADSSLIGLHILVVEDDFFVADHLALLLGAAGAVVVGPAASVDQGAALIDAADRLDGAVLDINLGGEPSYRLVEVLQARGVPVIFATGYEPDVIPQTYRDVPLCKKPMDPVGCATLLFGGRTGRWRG